MKFILLKAERRGSYEAPKEEARRIVEGVFGLLCFEVGVAGEVE